MHRKNTRKKFHEKKATHPKSKPSTEDIFDALKKSPNYDYEVPEFVPVGVKLKPGAFTNFVMLSLLLNSVACAYEQTVTNPSGTQAAESIASEKKAVDLARVND